MIRFNIFLLLLLISFASGAQRPWFFKGQVVENPQMRFIRLTTDNGLSNNRVTCMLQDRYGFIWVGTADGLNRYDGRAFEGYKNNPDNFMSISSSHISCMTTNTKGELFVGTKKGLNLYNRSTNSFDHIEIKGDSSISIHPYIRDIIFENDSILWVDTQSGSLIRYDLQKDRIDTVYRHMDVRQPYYLYHDLYFDTDSTLWIGGRGLPTMFFDNEKKTIVSLSSSESDYAKKRAYDVSCYYQDSYGNFWISGLDGAYLFDKNSQVFKKFIGYTTYDIREDKKGDIWFATGSGIFRFNPSDSSMMVFDNEKDNPHSVSNNSVFKIMEDQVGNLWFGTGLGINIYNPSAYPFNTYSHIPGISNSPEGYVVTAVAEDPDNNLVIGYEEDGIDFFNLKTDRFKHFKMEDGESYLADNHISALYYDHNDLLWIGLWRGIGFNLYEPKLQKFFLFTFDSTSLERDWYSDFCEDNFGNFYVAFWGSEGLVLFDRNKRVFGKSLKDRFQRVTCSRIISRLFRDSQNSIWLGTTDCGVHRYYPDKDLAQSFFADGETATGLTSNEIRDVCQDASGQIWVLTNTLQGFVDSTQQFTSYSYRDGFFSSDPVSILPDNSDNLWIATRGDGLFKFNIHTKLFTQFLKHDGIQSNTFTKARHKLKNGDLFFGGVVGFNLFNPRKIVNDSLLPTPFFGRLFIYDHIYSHDLNQQKILNLNSDEKVFTIELNSSDLVNPERYLYQCSLVGYDDNWVEIDNKLRKIRFAAVPAGNYTLQYRIGDRIGNWSKKIAFIKIKIQRPFYYRIWFITLAILVIALLLFLYIKRREYELRLYGRTIELQQRIFRLQMNPHFMGNSLIAIQNYIYSHDPKEAGNYLSDFARLFRLILNNSKSEFIPLSKELETLELYLRLQSLRFPDKFTYAFEVDENIDPDGYQIPPMLAQPMIENALEHGLFTKEGKGRLKVRFIHKLNHLLFEVDDDGIGLTAALKLNMNKTDHKSTALEITHERIAILAKKYGYQVIFEVEEKKGGNEQQVLGTLVRFTIPFKYSTI